MLALDQKNLPAKAKVALKRNNKEVKVQAKDLAQIKMLSS